jgi:hypothetical protein
MHTTENMPIYSHVLYIQDSLRAGMTVFRINMPELHGRRMSCSVERPPFSFLFNFPFLEPQFPNQLSDVILEVLLGLLE